MSRIGSRPKVSGSPSAVGYWGRDPFKRVQNEQIPGKVRSLLQDKLRTRPKDIFLWQQVLSTTPNIIDCSCVKDTTDRADVTCASCYGVRFIPGYIKFAHETLFMASVSSGLTLVNTSLDFNIKPNRILLTSGQLSGTIESPEIDFDNTIEADWDFQVDSPDILTTNTVVVEFSTDNGANFDLLSQINDVGKKPIGTGKIILRVTLTRTNIEDRSPEFEIVRIRHAVVAEPFIQILRPQVTEFPSLMIYGRRVENLAEKFWTAPLDFFDSNITPNTPGARIEENAFYERTTGINQGNRFVITKLYYNEEFGIFTHQFFDTRRVQPGEVYSQLVF